MRISGVISMKPFQPRRLHSGPPPASSRVTGGLTGRKGHAPGERRDSDARSIATSGTGDANDDGGGARNQCTGSAGIRAGTTCAGVTPHAKP